MLPPFAMLREQLAAVHESVIACGDAGAEDARRAAAQLWELRAALDSEPPFDHDTARELFARLSEQLEVIYAAEVEALSRLRSGRLS